jgi:ABC-type multidrug transport system ATPase subunit/ABC-type multidrug transport system permease subunit
MKRGISGGQKKRLTTGEMLVGPMKTLFMDEISNGLDSSTTYQIIACLQHVAHIINATILVSILQPPPEAFDLFDDIILLAEGKIVYHGPRERVLDFFESCGFRCPERKGVADFLQEVISRNDQAQYWHGGSQNTYSYHSVHMFSIKFNESKYGEILKEQLSMPLVKSKNHNDAISFGTYSLTRWSLFKACFSREYLLMKRNSFVYVFKSIQLFTLASIAMTVFLRTRMETTDLIDANYYMGALFYSLAIFYIDGLPEGAITVSRLAVFYKQRDLHFYPAWAYAIPSFILKVPLSILASIIWTCLTYFVIGYSLNIWRFFRQLILLFAVHLTSMSMFRFLASITRNLVAYNAASSFSLTFSFIFGGFIISRPSMPVWLKWAFWVSPLTYGEMGLAVNEFYSQRWQKMLPMNTTIGEETLEEHGLKFSRHVFWIAVGALFCFTLVFNIGFTLALSFLKPPVSRAIISREKLNKRNASDDTNKSIDVLPLTSTESRKGRIALPFEPLTVAFLDLQYYIETPSAMKKRGFAHKRLQLLHNITGTFRPGVLTALMGVSGAGKTTLFDVLAGRKTKGSIEGEIKIGGYPKVQKTFARISGYCEQNDVHSPNITVEESLIFSSWLRLQPEIDSKTKCDFVKEVLETVELEGIKDSLVGIPGVNGLSTEQRKRLTIAVELVANPSIMFLDEPTTGLDARAAAIVMRAVKRVAETGRTIVCTIHQPSIDMFESFDEIILLKSGGHMIYCGPLGQHSSKIIEYFESISGVPSISKNYNPATWILEVTSKSVGVDFAEMYKNSTLHQQNKELAKRLSSPPPSHSKDLDFPSRYSQNGFGQLKACLWKQYWSYWRSPSYNLRRIMFILMLSLLFGSLFFNQAKKIHNQQSLFNIFGSMYCTVMFCGINNTSSILPYVSTERPVFYRERFTGMYSIWAYALAQVLVEIPYVFLQAVIFTSITYSMIGYPLVGYKVFWFLYTMFCTLLFYSYLGMMIVSITRSYPVAAILQSAFYAMFHLFSGFVVPPHHMPKWWIWLYYLVPTSWSLRGLATSQYGDMQKEIEVFGGSKTVASFLKEYFGFHYDRLPLVAVVLILFPLSFATVYAYCLGNLKFQKR